MVTDALLCTLRHVVATPNRAQITWALACGAALSVWDHSRTTRDVDFVLAVHDQDADQMLTTLRAADLQPKREPPIVTVGEQRFVQFLYTPPDRCIDIQVDCIFADSDFQERALARRVATQFPGLDADFYVLGCENLIAFKLVAGRLIDLADAAALLRANQNSIAFDVLQAECAKTGLTDELSRIWNEAFPDIELPGQDS